MFTVTHYNGFEPTGVVAHVPSMKIAIDAAGADGHIEGNMTYDAAVKFIKASKGRSLFLAIGQFAPCADPCKCGRGFPLQANVPVSKAVALRTLADLYGTRFKTEALVHITRLRGTLFIGKAA